MVEDLLKSKADPNNKAEVYYYTKVFIGIFIHLCLFQFADQLPLYHARHLGNNEIVRVLKLYGAEVSLEHEVRQKKNVVVVLYHNIIINSCLAEKPLFKYPRKERNILGLINSCY